MIKILHIEDEVNYRESLGMLLQDEGFHFIGANNYQEGLELLTSENPDVVLCDVKLPESSGLNLFENVKKQNISDAPFIFLSGLKEDDDIIKATKLLPEDYLTKPVSFDLLRTKIECAVEKFREQKQKFINADNSNFLNEYYEEEESHHKTSSLSRIIEGVTASVKRSKDYLYRPIRIDMEEEMPNLVIDDKYFALAIEDMLAEIFEHTSRCDMVEIKTILSTHLNKLYLTIQCESLDSKKVNDIISMPFIRKVMEFHGIEFSQSDDSTKGGIIMSIPSYRLVKP